eukprot:GHVQ01001106.1.p1 GENE.GHVQ01001106.1~~GHVQ01001106.1.p1  ORF type:complete len:248 (+),score=65.20 GHVQ01001106.1:434-1177(+)
MTRLPHSSLYTSRQARPSNSSSLSPPVPPSQSLPQCYPCPSDAFDPLTQLVTDLWDWLRATCNDARTMDAAAAAAGKAILLAEGVTAGITDDSEATVTVKEIAVAVRTPTPQPLSSSLLCSTQSIGVLGVMLETQQLTQQRITSQDNNITDTHKPEAAALTPPLAQHQPTATVSCRELSAQSLVGGCVCVCVCGTQTVINVDQSSRGTAAPADEERRGCVCPVCGWSLCWCLFDDICYVIQVVLVFV